MVGGGGSLVGSRGCCERICSITNTLFQWWCPCSSPFWSYMLDFRPCICMVGLFTWISLSVLQSWVNYVRLVICRGGPMCM